MDDRIKKRAKFAHPGKWEAYKFPYLTRVIRAVNRQYALKCLQECLYVARTTNELMTACGFVSTKRHPDMRKQLFDNLSLLVEIGLMNAEKVEGTELDYRFHTNRGLFNTLCSGEEIVRDSSTAINELRRLMESNFQEAVETLGKLIRVGEVLIPDAVITAYTEYKLYGDPKNLRELV